MPSSIWMKSESRNGLGLRYGKERITARAGNLRVLASYRQVKMLGGLCFGRPGGFGSYKHYGQKE